MEAGPDHGAFTDGRGSLGNREDGTPLKILSGTQSEAALSKFFSTVTSFEVKLKMQYC